MDIAYISALSALAGSVTGGLTSTGVTWLTQIAQARSGRLSQTFARREELYRDFIVAASKKVLRVALSTPRHGCCQPGKEKHVAHSKRNAAQQQAATKVEAAETLNLGHAGLRSECWPGTGGMGSSCCDSESASPRSAVLRLHRPPRKRTPLHRARPSQAAKARFSSDDYEFLTDPCHAN